MDTKATITDTNETLARL